MTPRRVRYTLAAFVVTSLGVFAAVAVAATTSTTGTVSVCATASTPAHTVGVDGSGVDTIAGAMASRCATTTYTVPTVTETTTVPGTTTAPTTTTTPPPPPAFTPGIGVLNESGALGTVTNPNQYAQLVGGAWGGDVTTVLEKAPGLGLAYFNGTVVRQDFSTGVTYTQAQSNGWLLQCGTSTCVNPNFNSYGADLGLAAYQNAWISNVKSYLSAHAGVDGIFIDSVLYDPKATFGSYPNKYPSTAAWSAATVSFASAVYSALHPLGYYVELNAGAYKPGDVTYNDGTSTVNWFAQLAPHADGLMNEHYQVAQVSGVYTLRASGSATWHDHWEGWQKVVGAAQNAGDDFIGLTDSSGGMNTTIAVYGRASMLLEWDGGGSTYDYTCGNSCNPTNAAWTANVGSPLAAKVAVGVGYRRDYSNATILVNPSATSSQTFSVNGTSYTLAPTTAKIIP